MNQNRKRLRRFRQPVQTLADTAIFRKAKNANKYSSRARINPYSRISLSDSFLSFCARPSLGCHSSSEQPQQRQSQAKQDAAKTEKQHEIGRSIPWYLPHCFAGVPRYIQRHNRPGAERRFIQCRSMKIPIFPLLPLAVHIEINAAHAATAQLFHSRQLGLAAYIRFFPTAQLLQREL